MNGIFVSPEDELEVALTTVSTWDSPLHFDGKSSYVVPCRGAWINVFLSKKPNKP